jgi:hypothetical protein
MMPGGFLMCAGQRDVSPLVMNDTTGFRTVTTRL